MGIKTQLDPVMTSANSREESSSRLYKERKDNAFIKKKLKNEVPGKDSHSEKKS